MFEDVSARVKLDEEATARLQKERDELDEEATLSIGIGARSLIHGLHRPERMAAYGLDVDCPHIFMAHTLHDEKIG